MSAALQIITAVAFLLVAFSMIGYLGRIAEALEKIAYALDALEPPRGPRMPGPFRGDRP